jgi:hypothetical protein
MQLAYRVYTACSLVGLNSQLYESLVPPHRSVGAATYRSNLTVIQKKFRQKTSELDCTVIHSLGANQGHYNREKLLRSGLSSCASITFRCISVPRVDFLVGRVSYCQLRTVLASLSNATTCMHAYIASLDDPIEPSFNEYGREDPNKRRARADVRAFVPQPCGTTVLDCCHTPARCKCPAGCAAARSNSSQS